MLLRQHIEHDIRIFEKILSLVEPIAPEQDAKLQTLKRRLKEAPLKEGKQLIFTQYADTARYLFENLNPEGRCKDIEVIYSGDKNKARVVGRFAPLSRPEYQLSSNEVELNTLVATDVLVEGLNMQGCDKIINYDLHWIPVRLIQRFGRIDRLGSEHAKVYGPEHTLSLNQSQRYVLRELREAFKLAADEDEKAQINLLEKAFRGAITTAINRELNLLRKNSVRGRDLLKSLEQIYFQHNMRDWVDSRNRQLADNEVPRIICSEGLI